MLLVIRRWVPPQLRSQVVCTCRIYMRLLRWLPGFHSPCPLLQPCCLPWLADCRWRYGPAHMYNAAVTNFIKSLLLSIIAASPRHSQVSVLGFTCTRCGLHTQVYSMQEGGPVPVACVRMEVAVACQWTLRLAAKNPMLNGSASACAQLYIRISWFARGDPHLCEKPLC